MSDGAGSQSAVHDRLGQVEGWLRAEESEHLEFKEAKARFDFEELVRYCCALSNERGGHMVLGVTDQRPRRVVGSRAFADLQRTKLGLLERLRLRIDAWEVPHPNGRVVVFEVPSRPIGVPVQYLGAYWMRGGSSLTPMTADQIKRILDEAHPDFSAEICREARLADLDEAAIAVFRTRWAQRSRRADLQTMAVEHLLADADLLVPDRGLTWAALILLGRDRALRDWLGQAEVVFEYRSDEASIAYQQREEFRRGFLLFHDELWRLIHARNETWSVRDGLFRRDIPAFNEDAVREAILNAVCHRDYRLAGSTFVCQSPRRITITSPGGFPPDVRPENILFRQSPRNRRLAEAMARCGLVERSGQGADRMFMAALLEGKLPPDFQGSSAESVQVILHGTVQDEAFVTFLDRLGRERQGRFEVADLVVLDAVHRGLEVPEPLRPRVAALIAQGAIERVDRRRLVLNRTFYALKGRPGEHTRRRGLDRKTRMALLVEHMGSCGTEGAPFQDLAGVLPEAGRNELRVLLRDLKAAGLAHVRGKTRAARWFPGPGEDAR